MMRFDWKKPIYTFILVNLLIIVGFVLVKDAEDTVPEIQQRTSVRFTHDAHTEYTSSCLDCHHQYENGNTSENILDESDLEDNYPDGMVILKNMPKEDLTENMCAYCHNSTSKIDVREAFHGQCIKCHEKSGGRVMCGECHNNAGDKSD